MPATRPYIPRVLIAFDFDRTLGTESIDAILTLYDVDRATWNRDYDGALGEGWDDIIRRGQALIDLGTARAKPLGLELLREGAGRVRLYDGVLDMPDRLRAVAREIDPAIELEFVVLSSGYAEVIAATEIARVFDRILASTFHFDQEGRARCVKRIISHPQKALYLEALGKGVELGGANAPKSPGRDVDEHERHLPFDQMIYVGDGASDLQAFGFMRANGGLALAIDKDARFDSADAQTRSQRVDNLAPPDYRKGGELLTSLEHAVRACAARIALRALGRGE
jgi:phosphoglycolate phosphatase-like HAD superfamily hydrolase